MTVKKSAKKTAKKAAKKSPAKKSVARKVAPKTKRASKKMPAKKVRKLSKPSPLVVHNLGRQGDVLIRRVSSVPATATRVPRERGRIILAHGTSTGHSHAIPSKSAKLYADGEARYLIIGKEGAHLVHDEHATLNIVAGIYQVIRQRETSGDTDRRVED